MKFSVLSKWFWHCSFTRYFKWLIIQNNHSIRNSTNSKSWSNGVYPHTVTPTAQQLKTVEYNKPLILSLSTRAASCFIYSPSVGQYKQALVIEKLRWASGRMRIHILYTSAAGLTRNLRAKVPLLAYGWLRARVQAPLCVLAYMHTHTHIYSHTVAASEKRGAEREREVFYWICLRIYAVDSYMCVCAWRQSDFIWVIWCGELSRGAFEYGSAVNFDENFLIKTAACVTFQFISSLVWR